MNKISKLRRLELISLKNTLRKKKQGKTIEVLNKKLNDLGEERRSLIFKKQQLESSIAVTWSLTGSSLGSSRAVALLGTIQRAMNFSKNCTWLTEVTKHCLDELGATMPKLCGEKDLAIFRYQQFREREEMLHKQKCLLRAQMIQAQESLESVELEEQASALLASQV